MVRSPIGPQLTVRLLATCQLMPYHRFKIYQTVVPSTPTVPSGRYIILQLVPIGDAGPRYRIRRIADGSESLVLEGQIRLPDANNVRPGNSL